MEDIPPDMPLGAYGAYEPNGMCIWLNEDEQSALYNENTGVIAHEFTHYVHSISTWHGVHDLLGLLFHVHAGIQRLNELSTPIKLPLTKWANDDDCPPFVKEFVCTFKNMRLAKARSYGAALDPSPKGPPESGSIYLSRVASTEETAITTCELLQK